MADLPPGPWRYMPDKHDDWGHVRDANGDLVADCCSSKLGSDFRESYDGDNDREWREGPPQARAVADLLIQARAERDETPLTKEDFIRFGATTFEVRHFREGKVQSTELLMLEKFAWQDGMCRHAYGSIETIGELRNWCRLLGIPLPAGGKE